MVELSNGISLNSLSEINDAVQSSIGAKSVACLCLAGGIVTAIYQIKKRKLLIKKDKIEKSLDDYSYRDLFHFFINPEFHIDKLHLAKGF